MKKSVLIVLFAVVATSILAQYIPTTEDLDHFLTTKTLVVKDRNPLNTLDGEIEEVMEAEWDITEYEMIPWEEFEEKWRNYLKVRFSWLPIVTSTTTLWFLVTVTFILAYIKKKRSMVVNLSVHTWLWNLISARYHGFCLFMEFQ